jgi:hypothetical protein
MSRATPAGPGAGATAAPPTAPVGAPNGSAAPHPTGTVETGGLAPERLAELVARGEAMSLDEAIALGRTIGAEGSERRIGPDE